MKPILVDSTQCHLWTDALHMRQLAREANNRWDRATYVRMCVILSWTALEVGCQEALSAPEIGVRFKDNMKDSLTRMGLPEIDWSRTPWQDVLRVQTIRKSFIHKFATLPDMFHDCSVADDAISVVREALVDIYSRANAATPGWVQFDDARGWAGPSGASDSSSATLTTGGVRADDPNAVKICFVANGHEHLDSIRPQGFDSAPEIEALVGRVRIPISAVRVYHGNELVIEKQVHMRGNAEL